MVEINSAPNEPREITVAPATITDTLPKAMGPIDMQRAFGISAATFSRLQRLGEFKPFLLPRAIGIKKYSGQRVQAFLNGRADGRG